MWNRLVVPAAGLVFLAASAVPSAPAMAQGERAAPTVLITGSNRGLGFHFAQQFAQAGWNVIATARRPDRAEALKAVREDHPNLIIEKLDITKDEEIEALAETYREQPIDLLLNNAARLGELSRQYFGSVDYDLFREILEVNVIGTMKMSEAFIDHVAASEGKKIVNMGSAAGSIELGHRTANLYAYRSSKAALHFWTRHLAFEMKERGITVVIMDPGFADSKGLMTMRLEDAPDQETREMAERIQSTGAQMMDPAVSVAGMIQVINGVTIDRTGEFLLYDGSNIPF